MKLVGCSMTDEMKATAAFIQWQQRGNPPDILIDVGTSLKAGNGVPSVVLMENDVQVAIGFWNIVKYWKRHGFRFCL